MSLDYYSLKQKTNKWKYLVSALGYKLVSPSMETKDFSLYYTVCFWLPGSACMNQRRVLCVIFVVTVTSFNVWYKITLFM